MVCVNSSHLKPTKKMGSNSQQHFSEGDRCKLLATKHTEARGEVHKAGGRPSTVSLPLEAEVAMAIARRLFIAKDIVMILLLEITIQ